MTRAALLAIAILLAGCESDEERFAKWQQFCTSNDFTEKQCTVLYALKESSDSAKSAAQAAQSMSGVAIGLSAGAKR